MLQLRTEISLLTTLGRLPTRRMCLIYKHCSWYGVRAAVVLKPIRGQRGAPSLSIIPAGKD